MIRAARMTGTWYIIRIEDIRDDLENIEGFASEGTPIIIADSVDELEKILGEDADLEYVDD